MLTDEERSVGMVQEEALKEGVMKTIPGGFGAIASAFVVESLEHMIPWLIATCAVIMCDLACGIRCSLIMGERVRFSSAVRRTMGKMVIYYAFVVMVCMVCVAAGGDTKIDVYSCLLVCFIEGCSIISNIMKPKGYDFNVVKAIGIFGKKVLRVDKEDLDGIITKGSDKDNDKKE